MRDPVFYMHTLMGDAVAVCRNRPGQRPVTGLTEARKCTVPSGRPEVCLSVTPGKNVRSGTPPAGNGDPGPGITGNG
jgi:hypothetical protein